MKKNEMKRLALLGITAGVLMANQSGLEALENENSIDLEHMIAKPKCKAHGGCGGLTASRDLNSSLIQDDEELNSQDDENQDVDDTDHSKNHEDLV